MACDEDSFSVYSLPLVLFSVMDHMSPSWLLWLSHSPLPVSSCSHSNSGAELNGMLLIINELSKIIQEYTHVNPPLYTNTCVVTRHFCKHYVTGFSW